ncbi:hypothetical protein JOB18_033580 [Solea senegalensis]|uniref:Uncharacterized protein n=1 Tax=Solea senegalensis TaxID=28829 RepID=A0AAV6QA84_SOLSE|nr:hypothetical protein JOB18_033580 [Solea senegalensis]
MSHIAAKPVANHRPKQLLKHSKAPRFGKPCHNSLTFLEQIGISPQEFFSALEQKLDVCFLKKKLRPIKTASPDQEGTHNLKNPPSDGHEGVDVHRSKRSSRSAQMRRREQIL